MGTVFFIVIVIFGAVIIGQQIRIHLLECDISTRDNAMYWVEEQYENTKSNLEKLKIKQQHSNVILLPVEERAEKLFNEFSVCTMNEQMCWVMDLEKTKELSCQASYMIEEELKVVGVDSYASYWNAVRTIINTFE